MEKDKYMEYYNKLVELVKPLYRWYDIDKVKSYGVFVWTKNALENEGWNVFDINDNGIYFYNEKEYNECDIPVGAFPVIREIQNYLKKGREWKMYE